MLVWLQLIAVAVLIIAFAFLAISKPPRPIESPVEQLELIGVSLWIIIALVAAIALLKGRRWGWWLEIFVVSPIAVYHTYALVMHYPELTLASFRGLMDATLDHARVLFWLWAPVFCFQEAMAGKTGR
ncbi:MAG: hypothetical protein M3R13_05340 [Armatimonadota bacterium]|nr:hypothetical protein [Armatimonadota bacterium]